MIAVDFTRTAESVAKTGADLTKWAKQQEAKVHTNASYEPDPHFAILYFFIDDFIKFH